MSLPSGVLCPRCRKGTLEPTPRDAACSACKAIWPVQDGVLDLLPPQAGRRSIAQAMMEAEPVVRLYESRLWRRSPLLAIPLGISFDREVELILKEAAAPAAGAVLDLACGPGIYSRAFARKMAGGSVVGLDVSLPMLRMAVKLASAEGLANATFVRADALDLPFAAARFDTVNCCGAFHLFPDASRALAEASRVLRPGGRITLAVARRPAGPVGGAGARAMDRFVGVRAYGNEEIAGLLRAAGMAEVRTVHARGVWQIVRAARPEA